MKPVIRVQRKEIDQVRALLGPSSGQQRVNYETKNYREMVQKQAEHREKRKAMSQPHESPFKLQRFANVGALVFKRREEIEAMREGRRSQAVLALSRVEPTLQQVIDLSPGPRNYLRDNARAVINSPPKQLPPKKSETAKSLNPSYGHVPSYLHKYNQAAEMEALRRKRELETKAPPGMRLLSEAERSDMFSAMVAQKRDTILALNRVPLGATAPSILKLKNDLERKLEDLEKSLIVFARPKVYVEL